MTDMRDRISSAAEIAAYKVGLSISTKEADVIADAALPLMQPEIDRRVAEEKARLLEALRASAPIARTDVVKPVNGKPPYSVVMFKGFRIPFGEIHDIDEAPSADYGSGQAAAFADAINQALLTAFQQENSDA
jgi:hypothetical protein